MWQLPRIHLARCANWGKALERMFVTTLSLGACCSYVSSLPREQHKGPHDTIRAQKRPDEARGQAQEQVQGKVHKL
jgi:hypothetical protein